MRQGKLLITEHLLFLSSYSDPPAPGAPRFQSAIGASLALSVLETLMDVESLGGSMCTCVKFDYFLLLICFLSI